MICGPNSVTRDVVGADGVIAARVDTMRINHTLLRGDQCTGFVMSCGLTKRFF